MSKLSPATVKTRRKSTSPILGSPVELRENVLPTYKDVMLSYLYSMQKKRGECNGKQPSLKDISEILADKIENLWRKASISSVSHKRIVKMFVDYHQKYRNMIKSVNKPKPTDQLKVKLMTFQKHADNTLFDVSACKCLDFSKCSCEKVKKVPERERAFLNDQRCLRMMYMKGLDIQTTMKLQRREARKNSVTSPSTPSCTITGNTGLDAQSQALSSSSDFQNSSSRSSSPHSSPHSELCNWEN